MVVTYDSRVQVRAQSIAAAFKKSVRHKGAEPGHDTDNDNDNAGEDDAVAASNEGSEEKQGNGDADAAEAEDTVNDEGAEIKACLFLLLLLIFLKTTF